MTYDLNFVDDTVPLEKEIEKTVCAYAKRLGIHNRKFTSPAHRSVPDRIFYCPDGRVFWIEFKRPGGRLTPGQTEEIALMKSLNLTVFVVYNVEDGKALIDLLA